MSNVHPLKRKSVKPSSSTVRGMLPANQCRSLDAAMQSIRSAGFRVEWQWKDKQVGWVCAGIFEDKVRCEILATEDPLLGHMFLSEIELIQAKANEDIPKNYRAILEFPLEVKNDYSLFEFPLESTPHRDLFTNVLESLEVVFMP